MPRLTKQQKKFHERAVKAAATRKANKALVAATARKDTAPLFADLPSDRAVRNIRLVMPKALETEISLLLRGRGLSWADYVLMSLRAMPKGTQMLGLKHSMPIGKYRGENVETIVRADPSYMQWVHENVTRFQLEESVIALVDEMLETRTYHFGGWDGEEDD